MVILVCEMARLPATSTELPPRKCRMLTPFSKPARLTAMNSSALPWNQVAIMRPSSCQTPRKRAQSPASRHTTQFSTTSRMASRSVLSLPMAVVLASPSKGHVLWTQCRAGKRRAVKPEVASVQVAHNGLAEAEYTAAAGEWHQVDFAGLARLEAHRRAGSDIEAAAARLGAVELQGRVGLGEVVMRADLDRPVAGVGHGEGDGSAPGVELDVAVQSDDLAWDHWSFLSR